MHDNLTVISRLRKYLSLKNKSSSLENEYNKEFDDPVTEERIKSEVGKNFSQSAPTVPKIFSKVIPEVPGLLDIVYGSAYIIMTLIGIFIATLVIVAIGSFFLMSFYPNLVVDIIVVVVAAIVIFLAIRIVQLKKVGQVISLNGIFKEPIEKLTDKIKEKTSTLKKNGEIKTHGDWHKAFDSFDLDGAMEEFIKKCIAYDEAFLSIKSMYENYAIESSNAHVEYDIEHERIGKELETLRNERREYVDRLESDDIITGRYLKYAERIVDYLESGRSSNYQEALNLAIEEDRKMQEEMERRKEAARQEAILEKQADEARRHNAAMERAEQDRIMAEKKRAEAETVGTQEWKNSLEVIWIDGTKCYRDKYGNYYSLRYNPIPAPVDVQSKK